MGLDRVVWPAAAALIAAGLVHALYRVADGLAQAGRVPGREWVMLSGIVLLVGLLAAAFAWLDASRPDLLAGVGFATFLGMRIGQLLPRPGRRPRSPLTAGCPPPPAPVCQPAGERATHVESSAGAE